MKATIQYKSGEETKTMTINDFKSTYVYDTNVEVKGVDENGNENSAKIPHENFVSVTVEKEE